MPSRILIISHWNGSRHENRLTPERMLEIQYNQLNKLQHNLDKILIVAGNSGKPYLELFPDVLYRDNNQGSYGAWKDGYLANPDYEWYLFLEDDYTFSKDNFDQIMVDMWRPGMTYLGEKAIDGWAAISNGLTRGDVLRQVKWENLTAQNQYDSALQIGWTGLFLEVNHQGLGDMSESFCTPFWDGTVIHNWGDTDKPHLIIPMQML